MREIQALHAQLQGFRSLDSGERAQATEGRRARRVNEKPFCCPWKEDTRMDQCDDCKKQREIQWGRARELLNRCYNS